MTERQALIDAIKRLSFREQLALSLCFEHGLNGREIAAVLERLGPDLEA